MDEGKGHWWSRTRRDDDGSGDPSVPQHDPDPYSTPPYGRPGPWAPAPPVRHPAAPAGREPIPDAETHAAEPHTVEPFATAGPPSGGTAPRPAGTPPYPAAKPYPPADGPRHPAADARPLAAGPAPAGAPPYPADRQPLPAGPQPPVTAQPYATEGAGPQPYPGGPVGAPQPQHPGAGGVLPQPYPAARPPVLGVTSPYAAQGPWQYDPWAVERREEAGAGKGVARRKVVVGALVVALVAGGVGGGLGAWLERDGGGRHVTLPQAPVDRSERDPGSVAGIAARALPGVVTLHVRGSSERGTGTGFVLDKRGHILTNNHVVEPAGGSGEIVVTFNGGQTAKATVVGRDSGYDLAVVKVSGVSGLTPLALGNSDSVHVGDSVVAIGAPFDLAGTVTTGIISAKERPITAGGKKQDGSDVSYVDALQTDAPINPGNSGGPLVDSRARVIGINSAIRSAGGSEAGGQGGSIGLGFAIPINQAKRVAEELINTGRAAHPVIGVSLDMAYQGDGARVNPKGGSGTPVTRGGPADKAGIEPGDVIKKVDSSAVHSGQELIVKIRSHRPGDRLTLTVERGGKERTLPLTLGSASAG
ncbi:trypsin-like peptidase domain-containing protein [Streptomyces luteireticuli]|uniref:S1C family serine protease n=1 Tax=Streptomyces luteireticuli TaxID=173858 RepID=UPI003557D3DA